MNYSSLGPEASGPGATEVAGALGYVEVAGARRAPRPYHTDTVTLDKRPRP
jgi:hypothetical protein